MYGLWRSLEHFSAPGSSPEFTASDRATLERAVVDRLLEPAPRKRAVLAEHIAGEWMIVDQIGRDKPMKPGQRQKYDDARRGGSRGNLGPVPPLSELSAVTRDLDDEHEHCRPAGDLNEAAGLLDDLHRIKVASHLQTPVPYQYVVLLWAIALAARGGERLANFGDVRKELRDLLAPFQVAKTRPDPKMPWHALIDSGWWDAPDADDSVGIDDVPRLNLKAGLSKSAHRLCTVDPGFRDDAVAELRGLITGKCGVPESVVVATLQELGLLELRKQVKSAALVATQGGPDLSEPKLVPCDDHVVEAYEAAAPELARSSERRAAMLQNRYRRHLEDSGHEVMKYQIPTASGEVITTDLHDITDDNLIEVKGDIERATLRIALGQILDYGRYIAPSLATLVVPAKPHDEMVELFVRQGISVVWLDGETFRFL